MKKITLITSLIFLSNIIYSQSVNTFCLGPISVSLISGGKVIMVRKDNMQKVVSRVVGDFDLSANGSPTELLKINFSGKEYRYDLIRDGSGVPSVIIDPQGRKYNLCNSSGSDNTSENNSYLDKLKGDFRSKYFGGDPTIEVEKEYLVFDNLAISLLPPTTWDDANSVLKNLKNGWHFPSASELNQIYNLSRKRSLRITQTFWSSNVSRIKFGSGDLAEYRDGAYELNFENGVGDYKPFFVGVLGGKNLYETNYVMAIKDLSIDERNNYLKTGTIIMPQSYKDSILISKKSKDSLDLVIKLGKLYKIDKLEYSFYSIKKSVSLNELRSIILNEFPEWRLPTINELKSIYGDLRTMTTRPKIRDRHPNQQTNIFWSSTNNNGLFYTLDFGQNYEYQYRGDEIFEACIVREISESSSDKIESNNVIGNLEIAKDDFPIKMNLKDAKASCDKLGNGWRLPTKNELNLIYLYKIKIGNFKDDYYWSSPESGRDESYSYSKLFINGYLSFDSSVNTSFVRAVRDIKK